MSKTNNDISSLFKHLGTSSEHYKEIGRSNEARESEARWPLLASIHESATAAPVVVPAVAPASSPPQPTEGLFKTTAPVTTTPVLQQAPSRQEPSIALPGLLHPAPVATPSTPAVQTPVTPVRTQTTAAPSSKAEFIAPRQKSLVRPAIRSAAPSIEKEHTPAPRASTPATIAAPPASSTAPTTAPAPATAVQTGKAGTQIENMFARLATPKTAPDATQPRSSHEPTAVAASPKRSLFERLIRK